MTGTTKQEMYELHDKYIIRYVCCLHYTQPLNLLKSELLKTTVFFKPFQMFCIQQFTVINCIT